MIFKKITLEILLQTNFEKFCSFISLKRYTIEIYFGLEVKYFVIEIFYLITKYLLIALIKQI